jgi:ATP adenylyltransferase
MNDCPICAWTANRTDYRFVHESRFWRVVLAPNQSLLGRCAVHAKRHTGTLAHLTQEEMIDWLALVRSHEAAVQSAFGAKLFNWSCLMNHAYRAVSPAPHVHWWAVPRYDHSIAVGDWIFEDPNFGDPYDHYRWLDVPDGLRQNIVEQIQHAYR